MTEYQEFPCGCKIIPRGKGGTIEFCISHRPDNLPEGIDPKFKRN